MARRAGARSREQAAELRTRIWNSHRKLIVAASIVYLCVTAALIGVITVLFGREPAWFLAGAAIVTYPVAMREAFITNEYRRLRDAATAEEFTSTELRSLRRRGWKAIDHIEFSGFDVDHVAVGPMGIFVIETKHTNHDWTLDGGIFANRWADEADRQTRANADRIKALLKQKVRSDFDVEAVLMIWGDGRPDLGQPTSTFRHVTVVTGTLLRQHLLAGTKTLDRRQVRDIANALRDFIADKEAYDRGRLATA